VRALMSSVAGLIVSRRIDQQGRELSEWSISGVAVEPQRQLQGVGSRLVVEAIEEATTSAVGLYGSNLGRS
jgi:ribosomal protein S18 acetylase RimI-like enzyme